MAINTYHVCTVPPLSRAHEARLVRECEARGLWFTRAHPKLGHAGHIDAAVPPMAFDRAHADAALDAAERDGR